MPTLEDYEAAKAELARVNERIDDYMGNNPDKYRSTLRAVEKKVRLIEASLKASGVLPRSPHEQLEAQLDALFPNASSRQVVEFEGRKYMRRFRPAAMSNSRKTVKEWSKSWVPIDS